MYRIHLQCRMCHREEITKYQSATNTPRTGLLPPLFIHPLPFLCYVGEGGVCTKIFVDFSSSILNSLYKKMKKMYNNFIYCKIFNTSINFHKIISINYSIKFTFFKIFYSGAIIFEFWSKGGKKKSKFKNLALLFLICKVS